jgi:Fe-S-cluster containining protein
MNDPVPSTPKGSALECVVSSVHAIYGKVECAQTSFRDAAAQRGVALRCPPGCGACCEPYVPDVLPSEAAYAAAWILENKPEIAAEIVAWPGENRPATPPCPFHRSSEQGARCAIYPARFLLCRLFGASGTRDREGRSCFRPCSHMPFAGYPFYGEACPGFSGEKIMRVFGAEPPFMTDYSAQLMSLSPSESGARSSLLEALPAALIRLGLCISLAARAPDPTYSTHDEREES